MCIKTSWRSVLLRIFRARRSPFNNKAMASFSNATTDGQHGVSHVVDAQVAVLQKLPHVPVDSDAVIVVHELGQGLPVRGARFTDDGGILCEICDMVLNGPTQWKDHKLGNFHKIA